MDTVSWVEAPEGGVVIDYGLAGLGALARLRGEALGRPQLLLVAGDHGTALDVEGQQPGEPGQRLHMGALVAMGGVEGEAQQSGADVVPGLHRGGGVAAVGAEDRKSVV